MKKNKLLLIIIFLIIGMNCAVNNSETPVNGEAPVVEVPEIELVEVPAGDFEMGDNFGEGNFNEIPVHTVYLDAYYIGKYEVTCWQFQRFMDDGGYANSAYWGAGGFGDFGTEPEFWMSSEWQGGGLSGNENIPVAGVCWYEAMAFCSWLSTKTGQSFRLPTEAEWEKAARGDAEKNETLEHQRRFPWGDSIDGSYANFFQSGDSYESRGGNGGKTPVGYYDGSIRETFQTSNGASPYGAHDMAGNVLELCLDWYGETYYSISPVNNPRGPDSGVNKVMRGGGRHSPASGVRSSFREDGTRPTTRSVTMGFRVVKVIS